MKKNAFVVAGVIAWCGIGGGALSGAGPRSLEITFYSDPAGATLYEKDTNKQFGYTPVTLKYNPSKLFKAGKACEKLSGVLVRWASGAEASMPSVEACPKNGGKQQFTLVRPDTPGRDIDVLFALELQRNQILQKQANDGGSGTTCHTFRIGKSDVTRCY